MKIILAAMLSCAAGGVSAAAQAQEAAPIITVVSIAHAAPATDATAALATPTDEAAAPSVALAEASERSPFDTSTSVDSEQLGAIVGQADVTQFVTSNNTSSVSNNRVDGNSVTGTISFDSQSFQNMNGLTVLSANTGNNVAINAALNVNVSITP